jgi:hypothetical protein
MFAEPAFIFNLLLFIESPISEPLPIAIARDTGVHQSISYDTYTIVNMEIIVIIITVLEPCINFITVDSKSIKIQARVQYLSEFA